MPGRWLPLVSVPVLIVGLAACGDESPGSRSATDASRRPRSEFAADVAAIRAGGDGRSLVARVDGLPVDGSTNVCEVELSDAVEFEADRIYLQVTYLTHDPDHDPAFPGCRTGPREVTVDLGSPLAGRHVLTQFPSGRWIPGPGGDYSQCVLPACDPSTGVAPLPVTCDDSTLADAARSSDVPRHSGLANKRCELPWAVIDIDVGAGACPATGDGTNRCAGQNVRRTYWRAAGHTWQQVGSSIGSGCGDVADIAPDFPLHLCADLPPLP
ncbi:MAG TPA: hypothetical protein VFZ77_20635 [Acidimicrobiales bacterium]